MNSGFGIAILVFVFALLFIFYTSNRRRPYQTTIKFRTHVRNVAPLSRRTLSRNGPFVDLHLGKINKANPIGQTYYLRPVSIYDARRRILTIKLDKNQPPVHMNSNTVSQKVWYRGKITITDFEYGTYNPRSIIDVDLTLHNRTGKGLIGFHIHNGLQARSGRFKGFTNFGPIVYFLRTTPYWLRKKKEDSFPLPPDDATPLTMFTLHKNKVKKVQ